MRRWEWRWHGWEMENIEYKETRFDSIKWGWNNFISKIRKVYWIILADFWVSVEFVKFYDFWMKIEHVFDFFESVKKNLETVKKTNLSKKKNLKHYFKKKQFSSKFLMKYFCKFINSKKPKIFKLLRWRMCFFFDCQSIRCSGSETTTFTYLHNHSCLWIQRWRKFQHCKRREFENRAKKTKWRKKTAQKLSLEARQEQKYVIRFFV